MNNASQPGGEPPREPVLFAARESSAALAKDASDRSWVPWVIAGAAVAVFIALAFALGGRRTPQGNGNGIRPDAYAASLTLENLQMSQASNFAGGEITYIDGKVTNHGNRPVTAIVVRALFPNDSGDPNQAEDVPLSLIRSRDPYVDTVPVSVSPLAPGTSQDFRLTFEDISPEWNQQVPALTVRKVQTRP